MLIRDALKRPKQAVALDREGKMLPPVRLKMLKDRQLAVVVFGVMLRAQRHDRARVVLPDSQHRAVDQVRRVAVARMLSAHDACPVFDGCALDGRGRTDRLALRRGRVSA